MADLHKKQLLVIEALANGETIRSAAQRANCGERSIYRWMAESADFQRALYRSRHAMRQELKTNLHSLVGAAVTTLRDTLEDDSVPYSTRLKAAMWLAEFAANLDAQDAIEQRLADLEQAMKDAQTFNN